MDPTTIISIFSAAMQAIDTWSKFQDKLKASHSLQRKFKEAQQSGKIIIEGKNLALLIPKDILSVMEKRVLRCWDKYQEVIQSEDEYLPNEVDEATNALKKCLCRELKRIYKLNGSIPEGELRNWWKYYCVA